MNKRRNTALMLITLLVLVIIVVYISATLPVTGSQFAYPTFTPIPLPGNNQEAAYIAAQATLIAGQNEMMELSHQATLISLNKDQAANAAAQTTLDYNQRQMMELSIRGTEVSLNMARAAATQHFITQQTQMAYNAAVTAQSRAATSTYSAYILSVTQTAQAQAVLDVQSTHTAQENATRAAYALTTTPWAAFQADIVRNRNISEQRTWWSNFVVNPMKAALITVIVILLIVGGVIAYWRLMPVLELRLRTISRFNEGPLLVDGKIVDPDHRLPLRVLPRLLHLQSPGADAPQVEIIDPSNTYVALWIIEAEKKLPSDGRILA